LKLINLEESSFELKLQASFSINEQLNIQVPQPGSRIFTLFLFIEENEEIKLDRAIGVKNCPNSFLWLFSVFIE